MTLEMLIFGDFSLEEFLVVDSVDLGLKVEGGLEGAIAGGCSELRAKTACVGYGLVVEVVLVISLILLVFLE